MRAIDIIIKKRDGEELSRKEIDFFIEGFTRGEIPDYQAVAWAMAVYFQGMTPQETTDLTLALVASGDQLDLTDIVPLSIDKHSTGGVGDKTTLVVLPAVAACGVPVGKMSGRALGFTGGTLDKMESILGYRADITTEQFLKQLRDIGMVLCSQTMDLAPADGKLYALRDVTGTVPPIPLIVSSVMSKKIAVGAAAVVLDVKAGVGAFMRTVENAVELAQLMVEVGRRADRRVVALITDMNQPLGHAVGNALEVREAIETLQGEGPQDFREHCLLVAGHMLALAKGSEDIQASRKLIEGSLDNGSAFEKFKELVAAQGGDVGVVEDPERLARATVIETVAASQTGFVEGIHAQEVALTTMGLGAGRAAKGDPIDHSVGVVVHRKIGDRVERGDSLFTVHANSKDQRDVAIKRLVQAFRFCDEHIQPPPHLYQVIGP
ncbi:MAG: thymidine phosphorylase [Anaerolineae bacterium SM23_ 63]|nr:MAG: thymidine phosphorylase [Anaerolineae bacterium SM23_ 63]HEY47285.1 pyrimidine-nucleoside phosphorylase [Anaerolineae bacterium]